MGKVLEKIDYPTITFFAGLFIIVGAMEHAGLLKIAAATVNDIIRWEFRYRLVDHSLGECLRIFDCG